MSLGKVFAVHAVGRCRALRGEAYLVSAVGLVQGVHDRHDPRMFVPVNRVEHIDLYSFVRPNIRKNHARTFVAVAFGVQVPQYLARIFYQFYGAVCRVCGLSGRWRFVRMNTRISPQTDCCLRSFSALVAVKSAILRCSSP